MTAKVSPRGSRRRLPEFEAGLEGFFGLTPRQGKDTTLPEKTGFASGFAKVHALQSP